MISDTCMKPRTTMCCFSGPLRICFNFYLQKEKSVKVVSLSVNEHSELHVLGRVFLFLLLYFFSLSLCLFLFSSPSHFFSVVSLFPSFIIFPLFVPIIKRTYLHSESGCSFNTRMDTLLSLQHTTVKTFAVCCY